MTYHIDSYMDDAPHRKVVPLTPRTADLQATIRSIAGEDRNVYFSRHANDRMVERGISRQDAIRVLRQGHIDGNIELGGKPGEWKCKITANLKGSREIGVITIVADGRKLLIKTVEWEDL